MSKILIVDDDAHIRDAVRLTLSKAGYEVAVAGDGQAAMEALERDGETGSIAAVLCDLDMPGIGGGALIEHIQARYPLVPIIVLSGAADAIFLDALVKRGVSDWLRKPASREEVLDKVRVAARLFELRKKERTR